MKQSLGTQVTTKESESVTKTLPTKKSLVPDGFSGGSTKHINNLYSPSQTHPKTEERKCLLTHYVRLATPTPKPEKDTTIKEVKGQEP